MRYNKRKLKANRNKILPIKFVKQSITSYSGLQLFKYYMEIIGFYARLKKSFNNLSFSGDYSIVDLIIIMVFMKIVGIERLSHLAFIRNDPLFIRVSGLTKIPHRTTFIKALKQFTSDALKVLIELNGELVMEKIRALGLKNLTIDLDGTVLSTKGHAAFAVKGYNPKKKGANSYFPLTAHVAETGHFISIINRAGNNHDSNRALSIIKSIMAKTVGCIIRFRADSAFCTPEILDFLLNKSIGFAIKAPFWKLKHLKSSVQERKRWYHLNKIWSFYWIEDPIESCKYSHFGLILRKKVKEPSKEFQLDLFSPNNGYYEYSCIVTNNKDWNEEELFDFMSGRSAQENSISELKSDFYFDHLLGNSYQANSANLQIIQMAYNLMISMQIDVGLAPKKNNKNKKTTRKYLCMKMKTLRFLIIYKAGKIVYDNGCKVLKLTANKSTEELYNKVQTNLGKAA